MARVAKGRIEVLVTRHENTLRLPDDPPEGASHLECVDLYQASHGQCRLVGLILAW